MFILISSVNSIAQTTKIVGFVKDSITQEPIPFVNAYLKGSTIGSTSDFNGKFSIETKLKYDTLIISCMGYYPVKYKITTGKYQEMEVTLIPKTTNLSEVVILPTENPAHIILRNVNNKKKVNNPRNLPYYQCEVYNKIQVDLNNITEDMRKNILFKKVDYIFENVDTSTFTGKSYLPVFLSESVADYYFRKDPSSHKEYIKAAKASGIQNPAVSRFLGNTLLEINIYDDYIELFQKNFISPISDNSLFTYKFYLVDSANIDGNWCYKLMFKPKRKNELTFTGDIWIADTSFAVKKVEMNMANDANINLVNVLHISQKYSKCDSTHWMLDYEHYIADMNPIEKTKLVTGAYVHKTTSYRDYKINLPQPDDFYRASFDVVANDTSYKIDEKYWENVRHDTLNKEESNIYKSIDTLQSLPVYKHYYDFIAALITGYYTINKLEYGPYYQAISYNKIEGTRIRLGGQTTYDFHKKIQLTGYAAYGSFDKALKYGGGVNYMFKQDPRRILKVNYKHDVEQLGQSTNAFSQDNFIGSMISRQPSSKLTMVDEYKISYEHFWINGVSNILTFRHRTSFPLAGTTFVLNLSDDVIQTKTNLVTSDLELNFRFAYKEKYMTNKFDRYSFGTRHPLVNVWFTYGIPNLIGSDYEYTKLRLNVNYWYNVGSIGWSRIIAEGGKTWGTLPYSLLEIHPGNETFSFDETAFNRLNYYEFIDDRYFTIFYTHHFDGMFFNHLPLLRKLKLREVVHARGLIGDLSAKNASYSQFLPNSTGLDRPYLEAGVGIENILKVARVDLVWRLTHLEHNNIQPIGLMFTFHFTF